MNVLSKEFLYLVEGVHVVLVDKRDANAIPVGTCRAANAVDIVLGIVRNVKVDDHCYVVNVNTARHDIGSHEHIYLAALELEHYVIPLGLLKVGVHFPTVDFHLLQGLVYLLHLHLAAREDYHSFQVASLENVLYDLQLLRLIANICTLLYLLGGQASLCLLA